MQRQSLTATLHIVVIMAVIAGASSADEVVLLAGSDDECVAPVEASMPSAGLLACCQGTSGVRDFDEGGADRSLMHSFAFPGQIPSGHVIDRVEVSFRARPVNVGSANDRFGIEVRELVGPGAVLSAGFGFDLFDVAGGSASWENANFPDCNPLYSIMFQRDASPDEAQFLEDLAVLERIDVRIQDDTLVDFIQVTLDTVDDPFDSVLVGSPGNPCDVQAQGCFGSVAVPYRIAKFEVTNAQYAEFLNAVASTDTNGLYNASMGMVGFSGGIARTGSPGSYSYSTITGREAMPVNFVSFWDATRFANWLHNGQPTGAQDGTTTEDGAYTLTAAGIANNTVTRNSGAKFFVPSEDEWFKAAYYDATSSSYFDYPAGSDTQTACSVPGSTANTANCDSVTGDMVDVGSFPNAASPSGTFDQGGNVFEWNETIIATDRGLRGADFIDTPFILAASSRSVLAPDFEFFSFGFRVAASSGAPLAVPTLNALGVAAAVLLLGVSGVRRLLVVSTLRGS